MLPSIAAVKAIQGFMPNWGGAYRDKRNEQSPLLPGGIFCWPRPASRLIPRGDYLESSRILCDAAAPA